MSGINLVTAWKNARDRLIAAGVDSPVLDARMLLEWGAGVERIDIVTDPYRILSEEQLAGVEAGLKRREAREPVSHITGKKGFWTLDLAVSKDVLTPRPETELLVAQIIENTAHEAELKVADLGVGSGAILLAILTERPQAYGVGLDLSLPAIVIAQANADALGLGERARFVHGDWAEAGEGYDVIVSNPPYIRSFEIDLLAPEVARFEPRLALDGGRDGLDAYRRIAPIIAKALKPKGLFALELGFGQAEAVWAIMDDAGLEPLGVRKDLASIDRVLWGTRPAARAA